MAIAESFSWLEFSHIEFDRWALLLAPVLAVLQGIQFNLIKRASICFENIVSSAGECELSCFESFSLVYTGFVTLILLIPALVSFSYSVVSYDASWESIDYVSFSLKFKSQTIKNFAQRNHK